MEHKTNSKSTNEQDIDVVFIFDSLKQFIDKIGLYFFRAFKFLFRHFVITLLLIILGIGFGFYTLKTEKKLFKHVIVVTPNFNSVTYLYNQIENFQPQNNTQNSEQLQHINNMEITPVVDLLEFIKDREQNLQIARYMSENTIELNKYKKDNAVEKYYKYHKIIYFTDIEDANEEVSEALLNELNDDAYFKERQKIALNDTKKKQEEYEISVANINEIFNKLGTENQNTEKAMNVEIFSEMDKLLDKKNSLLEEINKSKISTIEQSKIIYDVTKKLNISNQKNKKVLVIYPILFLFLFLFVGWLAKQYKRYTKIVKNN